MISWPIFLLSSIICLFIGLFLLIKPESAIEIQRKFYEKINWKIEPISMAKEIRNTKLMGGFVIILNGAALIFILIR